MSDSALPGATAAGPTPFHDLDAYVALRRLGAITLSADGRRLVAAASDLDADATGYVSSLWEVDVTGQAPARRLTRSAEGETAPTFCPDGSLLFTSNRPAPRTPTAPSADRDDESRATPGADADDEARPALWRLPAAGGEASRIATRAGGVGSVWVARDAGTIVLAAEALPGVADDAEDAQRRKARTRHKVSAILHDGFPVRHWDHDLGPGQTRLFAAAAPADDEATGSPAQLDLDDLTPEPGRALDDAEVAVRPDGAVLVATWSSIEPTADQRTDLVAIDVGSGRRRLLASDPAANFGSPAVSPDGRTVVCVRQRRPSPDEPVDQTLWLLPLAEVDVTSNDTGTGGEADGAEGRDLTPELDLWPTDPQWSADGRTVYFVADQNGHAPVFAVDVETGQLTQLTDVGAFSQIRVCPTGRWLYAVRSSYTEPGSIVAIDLAEPDAAPRVLRGPAELPALPGALTEVTATAADGTALRAWLAHPEPGQADRPVPLLLWVHGGPLSSWNAWSWRWNPWLMVARGYAVLLPDPALSTGYGQQMVRRGWGDWGGAPFTDLMTITDAAVARPDVDETRTAAMGGSFGGYMANWIAGHTDRFDAIVTHASLWSLDQFGATTDMPSYWRHEMSGERVAANSPARCADAIRTPMLVIHGDRDYRVPIGEGLRLWWDLVSRHEGDPQTLPHRFLYFPDENHWVLSPQQAKLWYQTVQAFLTWHVLGHEWQQPELL